MRETTGVAGDVGLVIFDCDCVLVHSERLTVAVGARMLTGMGWPITVDEVVRKFVGGSSDTMLAEIERHLGPGLTAEFDLRSTEEIIAAFHAGLQPVDDVRELIEALHRRAVPTCIASSGSHRKMDLTPDSPGSGRCSRAASTRAPRSSAASHGPTCSTTQHGQWAWSRTAAW